MRQVVAGVVIAATAFAFYLGGWQALAPLALLVPIVVGVTAALLSRRGSREAALISAAVAFGVAAAFWLLAVIMIRGTNEGLTRTEARIFISILLFAYAVIASFVSGVLALIFSRGATRASA